MVCAGCGRPIARGPRRRASVAVLYCSAACFRQTLARRTFAQEHPGQPWTVVPPATSWWARHAVDPALGRDAFYRDLARERARHVHNALATLDDDEPPPTSAPRRLRRRAARRIGD